MLLVAYMQKKEGLIKRMGSNDDFVEQGHVPLLQQQDTDDESDDIDSVMKEVVNFRNDDILQENSDIITSKLNNSKSYLPSSSH